MFGEEEVVHTHFPRTQCEGESNDEVEMSDTEVEVISQDCHVVRQREQPELHAPEDRSPEALDVEGVARRAYLTSMINHLVNCPPEILDRVLEIAVTSERFSWHPPHRYSHGLSVDNSLEEAVDKFFAWPSTIAPERRQTLNQRAAPIFLKTAIVELPSYFGLQESRAKLLDAPKALQQRIHHVRRLILDVWVCNSDYTEQYFLQKTTIGIDGLKAQFPRLQACVISFRSKHGNKKSRPSAFPADLLRHEARPRCAEKLEFSRLQSVKDSIVKLIDVFAERGPGTHKYIRFWNQSWEREPHALSHIGLLVEVEAALTTGLGELGAAIDPDRADISSGLGEQLLGRAYRFLRKGERHDV